MTIQVDQNEAQIETLRRRLAEMEATVAKLQSERDTAITRGKIAVAAAAAGVIPGAIPDAVSRAINAGDWKDDGKGRYVLHKDGYPDFDATFEPHTPENFVKTLRQEAAYFWPAPDEAPADVEAGKVDSADNPDNPWSQKYFNLTKQSQIWVKDSALADRLAKAAGVPVIPRISGRR